MSYLDSMEPLTGELPKPTLPGAKQRNTRRVKRKEALVQIEDCFEGYVSRGRFVKNQNKLASNQSKLNPENSGAIKQGNLLLQGLTSCGLCGKKMTSYYAGKGEKVHSRYICSYQRRQFGIGDCQSLSGIIVDDAVVKVVLTAINPAELATTVNILGQYESQASQAENQWNLRLERARYEAKLAEKNYYNVDSDNRPVARALERRWNEKIITLEELEAQAKEFQRPTLVLTEEDVQKIMSLALNLPAVWQAETTTTIDRKQLLRLLVKRVTLTKEEKTFHIVIEWKSGGYTTTKAVVIRSTEHQCTPVEVIDLIRELSKNKIDREIATELNNRGYRSKRNHPFSKCNVTRLRWQYGIDSTTPKGPFGFSVNEGKRADGLYGVGAVTKIFNIDPRTVGDWCDKGILEYLRETKNGPRWIRLTDEKIEKIKQLRGTLGQKNWYKHL